MNYLDLTSSKDPYRVFKNAVEPGANERGFIIIYAEGNFGDEIGNTTLGRAAWGYSERGLVNLFQKRIGFEKFQYWAVVK